MSIKPTSKKTSNRDKSILPIAKKKNLEKARDYTANEFMKQLIAISSPSQAKKYHRYFKMDEGEYGAGDKFMGVSMGKVFALAKEFIEMQIDEIEILLENEFHEVRVAAVSIMDFQARTKKTSIVQRKQLFELYIRRHDRINNWDLVDRSAPYVVGGYLFDKPRAILYKLARSKNIWERRTAITCTYYFIRQADLDDTYKIAEILVHDKEDLIHKAVGGWIRAAGKKDQSRLIEFLDKYATSMPRTMLRYAIEHLDKKRKDFYMGR